MEYIITIDKFKGPMDLLLHLIKENDLDIYEIKIEEITKQYLNYINKMDELNLNVASEYLTLAAELIELKSRYLLPNSTEDEEENSESDLIKRLIEYKNYKEKIEDFKCLEEERSKMYSKDPSDLNSYVTINPDEHYEMDLLMNAFNDFLKRKELDKPLNTKITNKEYSVSKRVSEIIRVLKTKKRIEFKELFEEINKEYVVVTFLAILSLAKKNNIIIVQDNNFGEIFLEGNGKYE